MPSISGSIVHGATPEDAVAAVRGLAGGVMGDREAHSEALPDDVGAYVLTMVVDGHVATVADSGIQGIRVGYVDGLRGAHTQGESLEELYLNLREVIGLVTEDGSAPGLLPEKQPLTREN
ncbi:MAG TPA: type II toxin-antitoxin system HicB family antitoxin [Longimicrobium sp.]|nr:type II toxin-antitoxin system HicB family antitoxin [Longimicrobium sp.]